VRRALAAAVVAGAVLSLQAAQSPDDVSRAAWQQVDLASGRVLDASLADRLAVPAAPGSFMKLPALIAALASRVITPDTRITCTGETTVAGQIVRCSHPPVRHALRPEEALALSCNVYFATLGERLSRARLDGVLASLGLPPTPARAPMPLVATGLRATPTPPVALLTALSRIVRDDRVGSLDTAERRVVIDGLRGSAVYGTSGAFAMRGVEALAKTGTADAPGGGEQGLVVAVWPAASPTRGIVLLAQGAAGMDAADLAARIASGATAARAPSAPSAPSAPTAPSAPSAPSAPVLRVGYAKPGGGFEVRTFALEDYVARVLAGEAAARSPAAALEALAITARTFAVANRGRHQRDGFDLCPLTHCQVLREPDAAGRAAVAATAGQVLTWEDAPAQVFYTASCGGTSERPSDVWAGSQDPPYLRIHHDSACKREPHWASEIPGPDLDRVLRAAGFRGRGLRDVRRQSHTPSGRVRDLHLVGLAPDAISAQDFRNLVGRSLGWQLIKSTNFTVRRTGSGFYFEGHGFGHGVGLCVLGSVGRAEHGDSAKKILDSYFPGLKIRTFATGSAPITRNAPAASIAPVAPAAPVAPVASVAPNPPAYSLVLPPTAEADRAAILGVIDRALADVTRAAGRSTPADLRVVFHPSAASFQRETGESWWSAARTRGSRIDLLPPDVLRDRGTFDATVRHEIAHAVTGPVLDGRPMWVQEGAAMHFAGEPPPQSLVEADGSIRRVTCPSDLDLRQPASAAMARQAYGLAAACFERALAGTGDWTRVK
jgi:SpoIID/LytB domain protein